MQVISIPEPHFFIGEIATVTVIVLRINISMNS